ncbi:MAG: hypothetical protein A2Z97_08480 [Bdellovibrionales bacterium GWB1_52_6]|nr:MAG: hypothetical protein A2Z97_08480 [Bdellovibrionales bacterium GWB1_52_6]OFZ02393.1 MAG: hypothetical protein A2X97_12650 [Bdellovibrionales bacterium GWA1_52_35]HCM41578.1 CoF synthetase [Bdellovibrionales bacterium]
MEFHNEESQFKKALLVYRESHKSALYSKKYSGFAAPASVSDWEKIPVLTRSEIHERSFPSSMDMMTCPLEDAIVISTGGSSGVARYTAYTHSEWDAFVTAQARALEILGITRKDRVANLFIAGHFWPSFLGLHDSIKKIGAVHLPISANIPPEEIVKLCQQFEPTVMISLPTLFVFLADMANRDGFKFKNLRMINYAGEHLSAVAEQHVSKALGVTRIKAGAYTSSDAGIMGYQCDHTPSGVYHVPTHFQWIELIDFDRGCRVKQGEKGDVVVTNLNRTSNPIIRYRVGDVAKWQEGTCPCGDRNPLLKLAGRAGADFKLGGGFISMDVFENAIARHAPALSLNFQLEISDIGGQFEVDLKIEAPRLPEPLMITTLRNELFQAVPELRISEEKNYLRQFTITPLEIGKLPRSPITGKVSHLKDNRVL